ncbi:MAG: glycosyltransferase family 2 protein [Bacteroidales bacterium]
MKSLVTIVVPIYNVGEYLSCCLNSILSQNYAEFEVIGVDDCSTDCSAEIFNSYSMIDSRFRLVSHDANRGLPSSRNTGIEHAKGDYVYFLDSDDWISPHSLEMLLRLFRKDSIDIAMGGLIKCEDASGKAYVPANHAKYMSTCLKSATLFTQSSLFFSVISCNKLIRKSYLDQMGFFFAPIPRRFEDMLTYKWYLSGAKVSSVIDITYFYRERCPDSNSKSIMQSKGVDVLSDKLLAYADIVEFVIKKGYFNTDFDPVNSKKAMINLPRTLTRILPSLYHDYNQNINDARYVKSVNDATSSCKKLFSLFPANYISKLPVGVRKGYDAIMMHDIERAIIEMCNIFS